MSTLLMKVPDVSFLASARNFTPPVSRGLVGWWYPGIDATVSAKDFSFNDNAAVVGTPTYDPAYAQCTGLSNYFQTTLPETESYTILAVVRYPSGQTGTVRGCICGHWESGFASKGLYSDTGTYPATNIKLNAGKSAGASQTTVTISVTDASEWFMVAAIVDDANNLATLRNLTAGTSSTGAITGARELAGDASWMFGGFPFTWTGLLDIAHWSLYDVALTSDEIALQKAGIAQFMLNRRSITI